MRQRIEKKKADGLPGIRTGVWLALFGLVLAGLLTVRWFQRPTTETASVEVAGPVSSNRPQARVPWTSRIKFTPKAPPSVSDPDPDDALMATVELLTQDRRTWVDDPWGERMR